MRIIFIVSMSKSPLNNEQTIISIFYLSNTIISHKLVIYYIVKIQSVKRIYFQGISLAVIRKMYYNITKIIPMVLFCCNSHHKK